MCARGGLLVCLGAVGPRSFWGLERAGPQGVGSFHSGGTDYCRGGAGTFACSGTRQLLGGVCGSSQGPVGGQRTAVGMGSFEGDVAVLSLDS